MVQGVNSFALVVSAALVHSGCARRWRTSSSVVIRRRMPAPEGGFPVLNADGYISRARMAVDEDQAFRKLNPGSCIELGQIAAEQQAQRSHA